MMDDDQPRKDRDASDESAQDDLDSSAILARRRMFVASALAGMSLSAASCEAQVSGSVSGEVSAGTSSGSNVAQPTGSGSSNSGTVVAQPCLMVAATPEDASTGTAVIPLSELDAGSSSGHINVVPCLMVAAMDSGVRADSGARAPGLPDTAVSMPCLSMPAPMDAGTSAAQPCLRMVMPRRDAGVAGDSAVARDAGVSMPRPCLELAVPQPCLSRTVPTVPQPCLTPVRKSADSDDGADE
ncbi:MAG: hypothetical protein U0269_25145 [Polyangiales bacterium]